MRHSFLKAFGEKFVFLWNIKREATNLKDLKIHFFTAGSWILKSLDMFCRKFFLEYTVLGAVLWFLPY